MNCRSLASLGLALTLALSTVPLWPAAGLPFTLPPPTDLNSGIFGDFLVYSLPLIGINVKSTPGAIKDGVVVYTGAEGVPVTTNLTDMDDAFPSVTGSGCPSSCYFSTTITSDPDGVTFTGDKDKSWDSTLSAFLGYLGGKTPLFFFNQNETNAGAPDPTLVTDPITGATGCGMTGSQDLCVYGQVVLRDSNATVPDKTFEFEGPARFTSAGFLGTDGAPTLPKEYVLAQGAICLNALNLPTPCAGPGVVKTVNHNLGADQAAYAVLSPALNAALLACVSVTGCAWDTLSIRLDLDGLSNGYEQLFILPEDQVTVVPEPTSILLWGTTAVGAAVAWRRRRRGRVAA